MISNQGNNFCILKYILAESLDKILVKRNQLIYHVVTWISSFKKLFRKFHALRELPE